MCLSVYVCAYVYASPCTSLCLCTSLSVYVSVYISVKSLCVYTSVYTCASLHVHVCMHVWVMGRRGTNCYRLVAKSCLTIATPWTIAHQVPLSMGFSRQEYWSWLPFPSQGDLPDTGIEPTSPAWQADSLPLSHLGSLHLLIVNY